MSRLSRPLRLLDVGGTERFWELIEFPGADAVHVTLLNLTAQATSLPGLSSVVGDARCMDFGDASFDVVFSNSVIEHVGGYEDQRRMADEVRRVGTHFFVQTPNKHFIEPHFLFPFFQFLPLAVRAHLLHVLDLRLVQEDKDPPRSREYGQVNPVAEQARGGRTVPRWRSA